MKTYCKVVIINLLILFSNGQKTVFANNSNNKDEKTIHNAHTKVGIILAGSSITWGKGNITDGFSGKVIDYMLSDLSSIIMCDQMQYPQGFEDFRNPKQYKGTGRKVIGERSKVEFDLFGDEISICQSILRTADYGVIQVKLMEK